MINSMWLEADEPILVTEESHASIRLDIGKDGASKMRITRSQAEAVRAQLNRILNPEGGAVLDEAWRKVDALGGADTPPEYDRALSEVQDELRKLGALSQPSDEQVDGVTKWIKSADNHPPFERPFWAWLANTGIRKMRWATAEEVCDSWGGGDPNDFDGRYVQVDDLEEEWKPRFWCDLSEISEPEQ